MWHGVTLACRATSQQSRNFFPIRAAALCSVQLCRENAVNDDCSITVYATKLHCTTRLVTLAILSRDKVARQNCAIKLQAWQRSKSFRNNVTQQKVVKEFWRNAASYGADFSRGTTWCDTTDQSGASPSAIMPLLNIDLSLLLHTPQQKLPVFFKGAGQPPKLPLPLGILTSIYTWFIGPTRVSPQTASRWVQPFLQGTSV